MCQKHLTSYWKKRYYVNTTDNPETSPIANAVETPRGEHPSLQSKKLSPAVKHGHDRPTDSPWPCYTQRPLIPGELKIPCYLNIPWEEVGSTSDRYHSRRE